MNCRDVTRLLVAYLDGEVTPSERRLIQAHLAGCAHCQREQADLAATRARVAESLNARAAQAAPSPRALSRLQARLADEAQRPPGRLTSWLRRSAPDARHAHSIAFGAVNMRRRLVSVTLAAVLVVALMAATIPAVGAQVQQAQQVIMGVVSVGASRIVSFGTPPPPFDRFKTGSSNISVAGSAIVSAINTGGEPDLSGEEIYQSGDQFLVVKKTKAEGTALPEGQATTVNGQPAVLLTGLSGEYKQVLPVPDGAAGTTVTKDDSGRAPQAITTVKAEGGSGTAPAEPPTPIAIKYTNASQLVWIADGVRYEALSNLPLDDLLKAAADVSAPR